MTKLTPTQARALEFIRTQVERSGVAPTLREICSYMGYKAIGSAQDLITALRKKGFLVEPDRQVARAFVPTEGATRGRAARRDEDDNDLFVVPCLGAVPAGNPIEAVEDNIGTLRMSRSLMPKPHPRPEELFAVRARGDSMVGAGILDGDWLVVRVVQEAQPGAIVVARVDGDVTVKRLTRDRDAVWSLMPENPRFAPIVASEHPFELVGEVLALQRSLH